MGCGVYAVEDDSYMGKEFANNVESTCHIIRSAQLNHTLLTGRQSVLFLSEIPLQSTQSKIHSPHTVQRINSIVASFSLVKSKLIAIAASATKIVPR